MNFDMLMEKTSKNYKNEEDFCKKLFLLRDYFYSQ